MSTSNRLIVGLVPRALRGRGALGVLALVAVGGCSGSTAISTGIQPGEIIGSVEISADVPAASCRVFLEGTPLGARCNEVGEFDIRNISAGRWDLRIVTDDAAGALPARRLAAAANAGLVSDLGAVRLAQPGAIGGLVRSTGGADLGVAIVAVPEIGVVTAPSANGGYLLTGVAPGAHEVVLLTSNGTVIRQPVTVQPGKVTVGIDLDYSTATAAQVQVTGRALRATAGAGGHGGITVELVESLDGKVVATAHTDDGGGFQLAAAAGTYLVRASDGDNPAHPLIPSVVVNGKGDLQLTSPLTLPPKGGDLDGDGLPDASDDDIDGDGFANASDAFPYDPAEWLDTDKDGVGDRSDLRSKGGKGIDVQNPTPDTDGDGVLDFADDCPKLANPDQKDTDGDGVGDRCDDCPKVPNPDQKDSVGNGIGDACRLCQHNEDCGAGKLCQYGACVACVDNAQCGDRVCDPGTGSCVPCSANAACSAPAKCDLGVGRCVRCLGVTDCPANNACVGGQCLAQCQDDGACPGGFCVAGGCVACRGNADCGQQGLWCDRGTCRPQCVVDSDCDGGRSCDPGTHTCYAPCNGACTKGQVCSSGRCLQACDGSVPCAQGFKCAANACVAECAVDGDCANVRPFTICSAGQCVPSGKCGYDSDCPTSNLCAGGVCAPRPTLLTPGKGYACAGPCDCRQGEACTAGFCVAEAAPTHFVSDKGAGAGPTPDKPGDLTTVLGALKTGDVVAISAGSSITPGFGGAFSLGVPQVTLGGGYQVCAPNRWVRDPAQRSTLHGSGAAVLAIPGSNIQALDHVTVRGLALVMDAYKVQNYALQATSAPALTLSQLQATLAAPAPADTTHQASVAFSCAGCTDVSFTDLSLQGINAGDQTTITLIEVPAGSGSVTRASAGAVHAGTFYGVSFVNPVGAVTIDSARLDGYQGGYGGWGLGVVNAGKSAVAISGSTVGYGSYQDVVGYQFDGNGHWDPISARGCHALTITGNTVDGRGIDDSAIGVYWNFHAGLYVTDSDGTIAMNTVYSAVTDTVNTAAYYLEGPAGAIAFTGNVASGGGTTANQHLYPLWAAGITSGTLTISGADLEATITAGDARGIYLDHVGSFVISDTLVRAPATRADSNALWTNQSVGRVERCKLYGGSAGNSFSRGAYLEGGQIELYDSFLVSGGAAYETRAIELRSVKVTAVGNTIDAGSAPGYAFSEGVYCVTGLSGAFTSNLISGGDSNSFAPLYNAGEGCNGIAFHNNYFWAPSTGTDLGGDVTNSIATNGAKPDGNGNITGGKVGCYDRQNFPPPDYHLAANSPCIDLGAPNPTRLDGSAITKDIDGNARKLGSAPDIGCSEKM